MNENVNSWKAICFKTSNPKYAEVGSEIVVKDGVVVETTLDSSWIGYMGNMVETFDNWFNANLKDTQHKTEWAKVLTCSAVQSDSITPEHYNSTKISTFDVVKDWNLNFFLGNVVKYIQRAGKKERNSELQDLKKARKYLDAMIETLEREE